MHAIKMLDTVKVKKVIQHNVLVHSSFFILSLNTKLIYNYSRIVMTLTGLQRIVVTVYACT